VSANLELARSIYAAWERGDFSSAEWAHPRIEFERVDESWRGRWTGRDGMAEGWREFVSAWDDLRVQADEYRELDSQRVLVGYTPERARQDKWNRLGTNAVPRSDRVPRPRREGDEAHPLCVPRTGARRIGLQSDSDASRFVSSLSHCAKTSSQQDHGGYALARPFSLRRDRLERVSRDAQLLEGIIPV
jgi:hypothetical protein